MPAGTMSRAAAANRIGLSLVLPVLFLTSCLSPPWIGSWEPWSGSDKFTSGLQCGMNEAEIVEYAKNFPRLKIHKPVDVEDVLFGARGDTSILLELVHGGLRAHRVTWMSGFTRLSSRLKTDICTGQRLVQLRLVGEPRHADASVLLNGERIARLSRRGTASLDIAVGSHTLTVKHGDFLWSTKLHYHLSSSGWDRLEIPVEEPSGENVSP